MFNKLVIPTGGGGDREPSTAYVMSYTNPNYYIYKDGEQATSPATALSYTDDNIKIEYGGATHKFTVTALKKLRLTKTSAVGSAAQNITFTDYNAGDVIFNNQTNTYTQLPIFLQIME